MTYIFFFQAEDGIRDLVRSRGLGDVYKRQTINRADFLNTLRRVIIFSNKTTHQVILKIKGNELMVNAQDLDFSNEANERLDCTYEGDNMEIGFNAKFLLEMLNAMDNEEVRMELSTPCLLYTSDAADERSSVALGGRRIINKK